MLNTTFKINAEQVTVIAPESNQALTANITTTVDEVLKLLNSFIESGIIDTEDLIDLAVKQINACDGLSIIYVLPATKLDALIYARQMAASN
ncbi:hypothetical protein [Rahnella aceris]|uniref:hypothetical protein n=1 Tax=Rahnella sp. (strain Y9602) TaxID=2703885 RepID=UPI001C253480|nr:hypothetical protein [Rahnella aceris]MBU9866779.1 hypothetical protein [Rahnella aceris]